MIRFGTPEGRGVIAATVLGSSVAFLDGTVVNVALPAIGADFSAGLSGLQWVLTGYLLAMGSLMVLGGSLGDLFGRRRVYVGGLVAFTLASLGCGIAPSLRMLVAARILQGVGAAALVPGSLAILSSVFHPEDRAQAIGLWSGLAGASTAVGPFLGGWMIDAVSWRLIFLLNAPLVGAAVAMAVRHIPETRDNDTSPRVDFGGALFLALGLGSVVYALIEGPATRWGSGAVVSAAIGAVSLLVFVAIERTIPSPLVPLAIFRSRSFVGANAVTFAVYGALGAVLFLVSVHLQRNLGYSALEAGAATIPVTFLTMALAARSGRWSARHGARGNMVVGPLILAASFGAFRTIAPGDRYATGVLPAVLLLGAGLVVLVAPLTATVLSSVRDGRAGVGSAVNNAVARIASLLAIAVLPALAGIVDTGPSLARGFPRAMSICAIACVIASMLSAATIERRSDTPPVPP